MTRGKSYAYVIVGAGSAGCTLANRLTEDPACRVQLIEVGGWDRDPLIRIPLAWGRIVLQRRHDWMYVSEPEPGLSGRRLPIFRGKVIGGSSSINAMAYVRGNRGDYDRWAESGLTEWSYEHLLPYFRRQETWEGGSSAYRGGDGPLNTCRSRFPDPLCAAFLAAGLEAGYPTTEDYNGAQQEGFAWAQSTIHNGRRCSAAAAYLHPAAARGNLDIVTEALVTRVVLQGTRAVGVEYVRDGQTVLTRAECEVILSGGAINSPQLLMLSGIGDPTELARHGIAVKAALKGVGQNLQDHVSAGMDCLRKEPGPLHRALRLDRIAVALGKAHFFGAGIAASVPNNVMAFLKTDPAEKVPDLQMPFRAAYVGAGPYLQPFKRAFPDGFGCVTVLLRPESRGKLSLVSVNPRAPPLIQMNLLTAGNDLKKLRTGMRMARDILSQPSLKFFLKSEMTPGARCQSDADLDAYIRETAIPFYHPLGTCKMGIDSDAMAVLDPELRVRGIEGLRVADAAAMPDLPGGNINAPVIMIAEKAADLIRGGKASAPASARPPGNI